MFSELIVLSIKGVVLKGSPTETGKGVPPWTLHEGRRRGAPFPIVLHGPQDVGVFGVTRSRTGEGEQVLLGDPSGKVPRHLREVRLPVG